jgi:two-component system, chemotaxis family, CheB/CheR fusion protein
VSPLLAQKKKSDRKKRSPKRPTVLKVRSTSWRKLFAPAEIVARERAVQPSCETNEQLHEIFSSILNSTGVDFRHYKQPTLQRRIARRLSLLRIRDLQTYIAYLRAHAEEPEALVSDVLIHVTGFFRGIEAYENLKTRILPKCMNNRDQTIPFRVWVAGCSSGEEAYSIAITFFEYCDEATVDAPPLQIFASDISEASLQKARAAIYPETIARDVSKARLNRFFEKIDGGAYRIVKWIRETCLFSRHDVISDPPFAKVDLISCRNVLIYLTPELQKRVVPILHYALNPDGILWLGSSETISVFRNLFSLEDRNDKFYSKNPVTTPIRVHFPISRHLPRFSTAHKTYSLPATLQDLQLEANRIASQEYAPPGVVINDSAEILQISGRPAPYLELVPGQATPNLFKVAHPKILSDLRYLLNSARKQNATARRDRLSIQKNSVRRSFGIRIVPLGSLGSSKERYFSIFFEAAPSSTTPVSRRNRSGKRLKESKLSNGPEEKRTLNDQTYEEELIADYETTQGELISSNEELQSANEELQSTNEELETAQEELQSANEEMATINDELQSRNAEMAHLTNDLTNLLVSVDIPIVMVGPDKKIRRFTPRASQKFNVTARDVGRRIGEIDLGIQSTNLNDVVADVIANLSVKDLEARDKQGAWYRLQIRPYQTADNRVDGAVIALTDITNLKRGADELRIAHDDATRIIETIPTSILVISSDLRVQEANDAFYQMFQVDYSETERRLISDLCDGHWNIPSLIERLKTVLNEGTSFHDFELEEDFPKIGVKYMLLQAAATRLTGAGTNTALLAIEDLTAIKHATDQLRHAEEKYRYLLENAYDGILIADPEGTIEFANHRLETMFGYSPNELKNQPYEVLIPDQYREIHRNYHSAFMRQGDLRIKGRGISFFGKSKDGTVFPVEISLSPVRVNSKLMVTAIVRDVSERLKTEADRQRLLSRETEARLQAEQASRTKDEFLATLSHELRTPLTAILGWAQLLRWQKIDAEKTKHALALIEQNAKSQSQLIDDLLDVSRIQSGKMFLQLDEIEPNDCVAQALDSVRNLAETKAITIQTEFDRSAGWITADSSRLQQVFRNLLTNALKFTPNEGRITVRSRRKDPAQLEIQVEDTGKGIKPEFLPYVFTRFKQEDSSTKRMLGGSD